MSNESFTVLSIDIDWCQSHFHIKKLNNLFYSKIAHAKKIVFGRHHHQIIPHIIDHNDIILHNLDHHHDIQYEDWQITDIEGPNPHITCGCWVGALMYFQKIKEYYWYKNLNSHVDLSDWRQEGIWNQNNGRVSFFLEDEIDKAEKIESYDLIFVSQSPEYIAPGQNNSTASFPLLCLYESYFDCCQVVFPSKTSTSSINPNLKNVPITIRRTKE